MAPRLCRTNGGRPLGLAILYPLEWNKFRLARDPVYNAATRQIGSLKFLSAVRLLRTTAARRHQARIDPTKHYSTFPMEIHGFYATSSQRPLPHYERDGNNQPRGLAEKRLDGTWLACELTKTTICSLLSNPRFASMRLVS